MSLAPPPRPADRTARSSRAWARHHASRSNGAIPGLGTDFAPLDLGGESRNPLRGAFPAPDAENAPLVAVTFGSAKTQMRLVCRQAACDRRCHAKPVASDRSSGAEGHRGPETGSSGRAGGCRRVERPIGDGAEAMRPQRRRHRVAGTHRKAPPDVPGRLRDRAPKSAIGGPLSCRSQGVRTPSDSQPLLRRRALEDGGVGWPPSRGDGSSFRRTASTGRPRAPDGNPGTQGCHASPRNPGDVPRENADRSRDGAPRGGPSPCGEPRTITSPGESRAAR